MKIRKEMHPVPVSQIKKLLLPTIFILLSGCKYNEVKREINLRENAVQEMNNYCHVQFNIDEINKPYKSQEFIYDGFFDKRSRIPIKIIRLRYINAYGHNDIIRRCISKFKSSSGYSFVFEGSDWEFGAPGR